MSDGSEYSQGAVAATQMTSKKNKMKNQRRFSDEQIMSLETMFESETKLEPRKKLQLARELGLQPRQVAIWFQNKRARWKSKQIERDCSILRANYHNLSSQFETLKKEKHALVLQLQKLNDLMEKSRKEISQCRRREENEGRNADEGSENGENNNIIKRSDFDARGSTCLDGVGVLSDDDSNMKVEFLGLAEEESDPLAMVQPENWGSLDADLLDENPTAAAGGYQWWDFWS